MGVSTEVELYCDGVPQYGCATPPIFHRTGRAARQEAKERGWLVSQPGGTDYCPQHRDPANRDGVSGW